MGDWDRMELMHTTWPCCSSSILGRKAFVVWGGGGGGGGRGEWDELRGGSREPFRALRFIGTHLRVLKLARNYNRNSQYFTVLSM